MQAVLSLLLTLPPNLDLTMLESDFDILGDLYKTCKDAKEKIRYAALYAVSRGKDVMTVADIYELKVNLAHAGMDQRRTSLP